MKERYKEKYNLRTIHSENEIGSTKEFKFLFSSAVKEGRSCSFFFHSNWQNNSSPETELYLVIWFFSCQITFKA